jgi:anti-sigma factor RsiW
MAAGPGLPYPVLTGIRNLGLSEGRMIDPITETELHAFIDGQLDPARCVEVEEYLARSPALAARIMADMHARHLLRLAFNVCDGGPSPAELSAARRLERAFGWRRVALRLRSLAACVFFVGAGWFAHSYVDIFRLGDAYVRPAFIEDAVRSHETALIRSHMVSQRQTEDYDPQEIVAATGISLPGLPQDWRVIDTEVFPSSSGESVELTLEAGELGRVWLFASRPGSNADVVPLTIIRGPQSTTVYWQKKEAAFALTGSASEAALERAASRLGA